MRPLAEATIRAGLIDESVLAQFRRWKVIPPDLEAEEGVPLEDAVERIQMALESEEQVRIQATDLDLLKHYMTPANQLRGQLVLINPEADESRATKSVTFAMREVLPNPITATEHQYQYVIPWSGESIYDLMTNGRTYLRWSGPDGESQRVYFNEVDDLYFGDMQMFMVCKGEKDESSTR